MLFSDCTLAKNVKVVLDAHIAAVCDRHFTRNPFSILLSCFGRNHGPAFAK
jgi:hypothetical protein